MVSPSSDPSQPLAAAVADLQAIYGPPSQSGFGSAIFGELIEPGSDLEVIALLYYQHFVGRFWERVRHGWAVQHQDGDGASDRPWCHPLFPMFNPTYTYAHDSF